MSNGVTAYDTSTYHRQKAWRLERELAACRERESRLVRLLAVVAELHMGDHACEYLNALHQIDQDCCELGINPIAIHR